MAVTKITPIARPLLVSKFEDRDDLISALMTSCHVSGACCWRWCWQRLRTAVHAGASPLHTCMQALTGVTSGAAGRQGGGRCQAVWVSALCVQIPFWLDGNAFTCELSQFKGLVPAC